ncbi:MAG: nucleoside 2-deoxyribosyltransferase [Mailhella sp.]|nr:nucleoside 2-deoxyribosyltransferase [Mailhella sp.]
MKIYQAGPLFSEADQAWHRQLKKTLEAVGHEVIWPGELISAADVEAWGRDAPRKIMEIDRDALLSCDAVAALLDGTQVDDGTAWEIGFASARGIPVLGIRTDFRVCGDTRHSVLNAMIEGSLRSLARTVPELVGHLAELEQARA